MPRQTQQLSYASFTGGLVTEASPLTFPDGASIEENNFELTKQGTRNRRLGIDAISKSVLLDTQVTSPEKVVNYLWDNNGGFDEEYLCIAVGREVLIYDVTEAAPGDNLVYKTLISGGSDKLSLTSHAGNLIVANGSPEITVIRSLGSNLFSESLERLEIRDRVGMPSYIRLANPTVKPVNLLNGDNVSHRPIGDDLYLEEKYRTQQREFDVVGVEEDIVPDPRPAETVTIPLISRRVILDQEQQPDGSVVTRYQMNTGRQYESYMGFPIDAILLERVVTDGVPVHDIFLIFREPFFNPNIEAGLINGPLNSQDGVQYKRRLTLAEWNDFSQSPFRDLELEESLGDQHPHIYNLWNQGWGPRRVQQRGELANDKLGYPIEEFHYIVSGVKYDEDGDRYSALPAMSDNINAFTYPNTGYDNKTVDRLHVGDMYKNPSSVSISPRGRYVIDALDRGKSRNTAFFEHMREIGDPRTSSVNMSFEKTEGGATTVAEYAGRVWFAGFKGDSAGSTIRLSNKILYGQSADDQLTACYQQADPTDPDDNTLVDTDGGWVSIDQIDEVVKLVPTDTALIVFATNGVWAIAGTDGNTFTPLSSLVTKLTDKGVVNSQSIVQVDADLFYWSEDGLYHLQSEGFSSFKVNAMTKPIINDLVLSLREEDFKGMSGAYDERLDRLIWIIDAGESDVERRELIFHLAFGAFTINTFYAYLSETHQSEVMGIIKTPQFTASLIDDNVVAGVDNVVAGDDNVVARQPSRVGRESRVAYLCIRNDAEGSKVFFGDKLRDDFKDWGEVDASARLLTGYVTGGDNSRRKQISSLTSHFEKTETTLGDDGTPENPSSCLVQSQWEWTNDPASNKWSPEFQAYRLPRAEALDIGSNVAQGYDVITTKSKLRGRGRTVSLLFKTEEGKDCRILGWSMLAGVNNNV